MRKKIIIIILMILSKNGLSAGNDKVQIHKLCIPYYSLMLESIMKLKKEENVSEFLICDITFNKADICEFFDKAFQRKYLKSKSHLPGCEGEFGFSLLVYKNATDYYAKIYTDTAIFKPLKITSEVKSLINKNLLKKISFNKRERVGEVFAGSAAYAEESALYWDFKDTYYFVYGSKYDEQCLDTRDKNVCIKRKEFFEKLKSYIHEKIQNAEFEKFHDWEVGD